jgi:hypothetical protein
MATITILLTLAAVYLCTGFVFSIPFVLKGVDTMDEGAHGTGWGFRLIIVPGCIVFWPLLLRKWIKAKKNTPSKVMP